MGWGKEREITKTEEERKKKRRNCCCKSSTKPVRHGLLLYSTVVNMTQQTCTAKYFREGEAEQKYKSTCFYAAALELLHTHSAANISVSSLQYHHHQQGGKRPTGSTDGTRCSAEIPPSCSSPCLYAGKSGEGNLIDESCQRLLILELFASVPSPSPAMLF